MNMTTFFFVIIDIPSALHRRINFRRVCKVTTAPQKIGFVRTDLAVVNAPVSRRVVL
jgi:hypothetical protein